jgi:cell shape-determining protein MreC
MKSTMVGLGDVGQSLRSSMHRVQSFELENKSLRSQLDMAKEEIIKLNSKIILTKKLLAYRD